MLYAPRFNYGDKQSFICWMWICYKSKRYNNWMDKSQSTYKRFQGNSRNDQDKTLEDFQKASDSSYVGRKARNWKHFKGVRMQYTEIVNTMNREMGETILMFKNTKKPSRCSRFLAKLCNYMFLLFINMLRFGWL